MPHLSLILLRNIFERWKIDQDKLPVVSIVKLHNYFFPGGNCNNTVKHATSLYSMNAYLCVLDSDQDKKKGVHTIARKFAYRWNCYMGITKNII